MIPLPTSSDSEAEELSSSHRIRPRFSRWLAASASLALGAAVLCFVAAGRPVSFHHIGVATQANDASVPVDIGVKAGATDLWNLTLSLMSPGVNGSTKPFDKLGKCALIGSSPNTQGKGYGEIIDSADTVIRVNRIPRVIDYKDLGNKTTILNVNNLFMYYDSSSGVFVPMTEAMYVGGVVVNCHTPGACPFDALVFQYAPHAPQMVWDVLSSEEWWGSLPQAVAHERHDVHEAIYCLAIMDGDTRVTGGLRALMTFLPICDTLRTYGFGGTGTLDAHPSDAAHSMDREHGFMARLMSGEARPEAEILDTPKCRNSTSKTLAWMRKNMGHLRDRFSMHL